MNTSTAIASSVRDGRSLLSDTLFARLAARIGAEHPEIPDGMPERILDQALAFLGACAVATQPIGPSDLVDIGWHTFILHTEDYLEFCYRVAGRFIHHVPDDDAPDTPPTTSTSNRVRIADAVAAIRAAGFRIDPDLWPGFAADCSSKCTQCHAGCTNSPTR